MKRKRRSPRTKVFTLAAEYLWKRVTKTGAFPQWAYVTITRRCNEHCSYCYVVNSNPCGELAESELQEAIDRLYDLGTRWVSFTGGEPTLRRRELVESIRYASLGKGMFTQLPTNGSLLSKEYLDELAEAGLDLLDVSFDSARGFDGTRKDASHRGDLFRMIQSTRARYDLALKINMVITPQNYDEIDALMEFARAHDAIVSARLAVPPPLLPSRWHLPEGMYFTNQPSDVEIVRHVATKLTAKKNAGYITSEPVQFYQLMPAFVSGEKGIWQCDACRHNLTIDSDGTVRVCAFLPYEHGRLNIHFRQLGKEYFRQLHQAGEIVASCNDNCLSAAYACSQYYRVHPLAFVMQKFLRKRPLFPIQPPDDGRWSAILKGG